jgi:hypothetical protein
MSLQGAFAALARDGGRAALVTVIEAQAATTCRSARGCS